jgi:hypothetical protein
MAESDASAGREQQENAGEVEQSLRGNSPHQGVRPRDELKRIRRMEVKKAAMLVKKIKKGASICATKTGS